MVSKKIKLRTQIYLKPSGSEKYNVDDLCQIVEEIKPKYLLVWHPWEGYEDRLIEYLNWDYTTYKNHPQNIQNFENKLIENDVICYVVLGTEYNDKKFLNYKTNPIKNFKILFWPTALLHYTYYGMVNFYGDIENSIISYENFNKIYLNLNNHATEHRSFLIDYLSKYDLMNHGINTWNTALNKYEYPYENWKPKILKFDEFDTKQLQKSFSKNLINSGALFNLVTETHYNTDNIFYTEKTFKPLLLGQPFLILGNVNQNLNLSKYGFAVYDKIIDYSFDKIYDLKFRILGIIDNLMKLKYMDLNDVYELIKHEIEYNRKLAISIIKKDPYIPKEINDLYLNYGDYFLNLFKPFNENYNSGFGITKKLNLIDEIFKDKII